MKTITICLQMGALAPDISEQLAEQGMTLKPGQDVRLWQKDMDAITRCLIKGYMPESTAARARKRLMKNIVAQIIPIPQEK